MRPGIAAKDWAPLFWPPPPTGAGSAASAVMWIRANLARDGVHDFYPAVGCRRVKDQRVYEYPL